MTWLSQRLRELLNQRKLSIQAVAREVAVERAYLSLIVTGTREPSEDLVRRLAVYFGENPEDWAFRVKAQPRIDEYREKYPTSAPAYMRKVVKDDKKQPPSPKYKRDRNIERGFFSAWKPETDFLPMKRLERFADETLLVYASKLGREPEFPLDCELLVREVFGLDVVYDGEGVLDQLDPSLLGCLYPPGSPSPWNGKDGLIAVNCSPRYQSVTAGFTVLHEGGHFVFHHPKDAVRPANESVYCRSEHIAAEKKAKVPPREWQASRFASEVLMPKSKVAWLLDGKQPPEVVNLDIYGSTFRSFFGVSQAAMEKRLYDLGYKCAHGRYAYANVTAVR